MDYGMRDGVLRMKLRAATTGYILRKWSVDCSPDHSLRGHDYRLWLNAPPSHLRREECHLSAWLPFTQPTLDRRRCPMNTRTDRP